MTKISRIYIAIIVALFGGLFCFSTPADLKAADGGSQRLIQDAHRGIIEAQYTLGHLYFRGFLEVEKDWRRSVFWLEQAARGGHHDAPFDLGMLYLNMGNRDKTLYWLRYAAEANHMDAAYFLGLALAEQNPRESAEFLKQSADAGHREAGEKYREICLATPALCQ
ncbi:MAG: sel1 repeat family protein [Desulfobulbaceae bacterium]|nr:MAG: sel1 repeat family protein [Desulfobulbaceae bacterium]